MVRSDAGRAAVRAAGAIALPANAVRRRLEGLAQAVIHSAPPPPDAFTAGREARPFDPVTRHWSLRLRRPRPRSPDAWQAGLDAGRRPAAPRRLVYLSTTGVYGDRLGGFVDETTTVAPLTDRARRRVDAERRLRAAGRGPRQPARPPGRRRRPALGSIVLRVPGIYALDRLPLERLRQRVPALARDDDVRTNHIHADDLSRLAVLALLRARPQRTINVVDDSGLAMSDYLDLVAAWAGLPPPPRVDRATLLAQVSPIRASFMSESRQIGNARMKDELRARLAWPTVMQFLDAQPRDAQPTAPDSAQRPASYIMRAKPV